MNTRLNNQAFTLLEVIVALGIMTMGILGVFSLIIRSSQSQSMNRNHLIGSMLAQEGLELIRNLKDENYITAGNSWDTDISDWISDSYIIDYNGRASIDNSVNSITDNGARLYYDSVAGFYTHNAAGNSYTPFRRIITITNETATSLVVNCKVSWSGQGHLREYIVESELHDWR